MILTPGQRFSSSERTAYEIAGHARSCARHSFYWANKVFLNYRDQDKTLYEAGADEWLRVLVRCPRLCETESTFDFERMQSDLAFELECVLDLPETPWFPEPVDRVELAIATESGPAELPLLILADPLAEPVADGPPKTEDVARLARFLREVLAMIDTLHRERLVLGPLEPADFSLDETGRWSFLGTDQIRRAETMLAPRDDLVHWSRFCRRVLTGPPDLGLPPASELVGHSETQPAPSLILMGAHLNEADRDDYRWLIERMQR